MCRDDRKREPASTTSRRMWFESFLIELTIQFKISTPTIIGQLLYKLPWMISLHFVGTLGPEQLAAAALATTLCNVTGMSFSVGLSSAITTLTGQSRGDLLRKGDLLKKRLRREEEEEEHYNTDEQNKMGQQENDESSTLLEQSNQDIEECLQTLNSSSTSREGIESAPSVIIENDKEQHSLKEEEEEEGLSTESASAGDESMTESSPLLLSNGTHYDSNSIFESNDSATTTTTMTNTTSIVDLDDMSTAPLQPLVYLYRGIIIQLAFVIPIGIYWIMGIKPLLLYLGQDDTLSTMTETYLRVLTPGLWSYSINWTFTAWLQCLELTDISAFAAFIGFTLHIPFNILFVNILNFGYIGVGMATVMFQLIQPFLICFYLFGTTSGTKRVLQSMGALDIGRDHITLWKELNIAISSLSGIRQFLSLALPGIVAISEWWASEIAIFLGGQLNPNPEYSLGAMSIYQSLNSFCFMFPIGFSASTSARVGMFLGKDDPMNASLACKVGILGAAILSTTMGIILYFTPHRIFPSLFSPDNEVIKEASQTLPFLAFYVFADGVQVALNGIIKGCGRQAIVMPIVIIAYWFIGLPLAYYNSFIRNEGTTMCDDRMYCGTVGLVFGMTTGTWVHMLLLAIAVTISINWKSEAARAQQRISMEKNK